MKTAKNDRPLVYTDCVAQREREGGYIAYGFVMYVNRRINPPVIAFYVSFGDL